MKPTLKIVYLITRSNLGGAQNYVKNLIEGFKNQYQVYLVTGEEDYLTNAVRQWGVPVYILPNLTREVSPIRDYLAVKECLDIIKKIQPDLIHVNSSKAGIIGRLAGKICQVPTVFTAHGWAFVDHTPKVRRLIALVSEKLTAKLGQKIICISQNDQELAIKLGMNPQSLIKITTGIPDINLPLANPLIQPPRLIMVARFNEQKDQETLIYALAKLSDLTVTLDLVGTGINLQKCQQLTAALGLNKQINFLGDRHDVPSLLSQRQIFILSTNYEGFPISILEAMRAGLPIIATSVNGIPEAVKHQDNGILIPHGDVNTLVTALKTLINDPSLRQTMGQRGRQKYLKSFNIEEMLAKINSLYQEIINSKK